VASIVEPDTILAWYRKKYRKNKAPFHAVPPARGASAPLPPAGAAAARGGSGWGGSGTTARAGLIQRDERRCKLVQSWMSAAANWCKSWADSNAMSAAEERDEHC
jgi:hypothetical protein